MVRRRGKTSRDRGMTLVEIMITLIISSIIAASTFMFFAGQQRIYETQTKLLNIQQNLWAAMEVVARHARAAGSGMYECVRPASYYNATLDNGSRLLSTSPSDGPMTSDLATRPQVGLRAFDAASGNMQWIPPLWIVNNSSASSDATLGVIPGTDVISVAFGNRTSGTDVDATLALNLASAASTSTISLASTGGATTGDMFRQGEFILLLQTPPWGFGSDPQNDRGCSMFQVTANPAGGITLAHAASAINSGDIVWNPAADVPGMIPGGGYVGGSAGVRNFGQLTWITFFVQMGKSGIPNLMMWQRHLSGTSGAPQILAEGIEDLQVSFACDTGSLGLYDLTGLNGQLDEGPYDNSRQQDEWWNNVPSDTLPAINTNGFCNLPTAVRLTLVVRTLAPDDLIDTNVTTNGPIDVEDHRYSSPRPTDHFRRRVLTTTVYPRNNKPQ
jgi:prepilin-type N-terminal cleavage/methylation domain-containing protein